jgi:type 1 fimbria pilin
MFRSSVIIFLLTFTSIANSNAQIVALGASSTAGYGVGMQAAYPAQLEEILRAKGRPMTVINAGISGDATGGMLARLSAAVPLSWSSDMPSRTHRASQAGAPVQTGGRPSTCDRVEFTCSAQTAQFRD